MVWRAFVAPHPMCQILWCVDSSLSRHGTMSTSRWRRRTNRGCARATDSWKTFSRRSRSLPEAHLGAYAARSERTKVVAATVPQIMEELRHLGAYARTGRGCSSAYDRPSTRRQACRVSRRVKYIDKVVDMPVVMQRQVPRIQTVLKTVKVPINQVTKHAEFRRLNTSTKLGELWRRL